MIEGLLALPSRLRVALIEALESGYLALPCSPAALAHALGARDVPQSASEALERLQGQGASALVIAAWLRSLEAARAEVRSPELVWTGPAVQGLHARDTRQVYEQLFRSAERRLWVSSYAYFDGPRAFDLLARRMDQCPGLEVTLLLNLQSPRQELERVEPEELITRFSQRFWKHAWPGQRRPEVFFDPRVLERSPDRSSPAGLLHAKAVLADDRWVFITSANLTAAAWDQNIELGLLTEEPPLAAQIARHFEILIARKLLVRLP
jgi:phosphatidylserine/phosphatidylglycerophosphate/cardiolipin synthase-like enzyme